ncbi:purine-nucleoside phosphorylase [Legionella oakridgensis]|uniref:Purine nucleoside phosphorylase n=2 Tax=Legionella oakridgensis TaxID=29423 RepID=W0BF75_9GAMM|nr:purine-nucleoside phosphorylase [Legionella oakridgensis]AHE67326.1 purine nucleoside phosphorylase I, inosine and guanosine-specific [Legionella oakridgensis ATCC 33761 = DSM 21215]ETO93076.1 purine nucleoside phosphorylase I, inosine and guanosine-specific [Legionella oakridgensis RV-2-2007]KTD37888.1 purine nucleoside phosphorylase [Legionella oakridgensis]STY20390.1 xanthosine phosphorylase [Legionella longbeachae]
MSNKKLTDAHIAAEQIIQRLPSFKPTIGIVLGSGLGSFAEQLDDPTYINYEELPGFPKLTVHGHGGKLVLGHLSGVGVVCLQGRSHTYEGTSFEVVKTYVRTLKLLGCNYFLATNASGSLREDVGPGELMLITDHINMQPGNPLVGPNDEEFGPRFFPLDNAYDHELREKLLILAHKENISLHQGVYLSVLGPNYETAAEIRAFRILGADAVGMSTVPEVLVANHCGMKVGVIATITNYATGLSHTSHSHEAVVLMASQAAEKLNRLVKRLITELM